MLFSLLPFFFFSLVIADDPTTCSDGEVLVTIQRTTNHFSTEESFTIYQGEGTSGALKFTQPTVFANLLYTWTVCLVKTLHTVVMTDAFGDGWSLGSQAVFIWSGFIIATVTLNSGNSGTATFGFPDGVFEDSMWQYTSIPQTGTEWTTSPCTWDTPTVYPTVSTITRYFRISIDAPSEPGYSLKVSVNTKYGFRFYYNGQVVFSNNLPESVDSTTQATAVTQTAVLYSYSTLRTMFPGPFNGKIELAAELHGTSATQSGDESFSATVLISYDEYTISDPNATITTSLTSGWATSESPDKLFDGSVYTKWCVSISQSSFPVSVIYKLPTGKRELMTKYSFSSANDASVRDCKSWKIYGSNDNTQWTLIDTQNDQVFATRYQTKTYNTSNHVSYNAFKWECLEINTFAGSNNYLQMSEWVIKHAEIEYIAPGISYPDSAYTFYANASIVSISTGKDGYTDWTITGGALPAGLVFNINNGEITGIPTEAMTATVYTVTAVYSVDSQTYNTTVVIIVNDCSLPSYVPLIASKTNYASLYETWTLKNGDGKTVMSTLHSTAAQGKCLPIGEYTLTLSSSSSSWSSSSSLVLSIASSPIGSYSLNSGSTSTQVFTVPLSAPSGVSYSLSSYFIAQDQFFTITPEVVGVLLTFSIQSGSLPQGLTLNSSTGVISGIPTVVVSNQTVSIKVSNLFGQQSTTVVFTVMVPPVSLSYSSQTIPKLQQASIQPVYVGGPCTFSISAGSLPSGLSLDSSTGVISGSPSSTSSQQTVTIKAQNAVGEITSSLTITPLRMPSDFIYSPSYYNLPVNRMVNVIPSSIIGDALTFVVTNGALPSQITLDSQTGVLNGYVTLSYPNTTITIKAYNSVGFTTTEISFKFTVPPSSMKYPQSQYFIPVGEPFSASLSCNGDPSVLSVSAGELPDGLTFDSLTGVIEGTPTEYTLSTVTITATNDGGMASVVLEITVLNTPSIHYANSVVRTVRNEPFSLSPTYSGELSTFKLTGDPPTGYQLNSETGEISGICPTTGEWMFQISLINKVGSANTEVTIKVSFFSLTVWIIIVAVVLVFISVIIVLYVISSKRQKKQLPVVKKLKNGKPIVVKKSESSVHQHEGESVNSKPVEISLNVCHYSSPDV